MKTTSKVAEMMKTMLKVEWTDGLSDEEGGEECPYVSDPDDKFLIAISRWIEGIQGNLYASKGREKQLKDQLYKMKCQEAEKAAKFWREQRAGLMKQITPAELADYLQLPKE